MASLKYKYYNNTGASLTVDGITIAAFDAYYSATAVPELDALDGISIDKYVDLVPSPDSRNIADVKSISTYTDSAILAITDLGNIVKANKGTAMSITVPPNADVAFPIGSVIEIENTGAGVVTIVAGSGVTINKTAASLAMSAQYGMVTLRKMAINTWNASGDLT